MAEPRRPLLVFDSGLGGLTVLRAVRETPHGRPVIYVADDAAFPYGDWPEPTLRARLVALFSELLARYRPAIVVLACNTASTLALADLRRIDSQVTFIGTVPAIKPAAQHSESGVIALLSTPATARQPYTRDLIDRYAAHCHVEVVPSGRLARLAESHVQGRAVSERDVLGEIAACFVTRDGQRTDVVVLACTHYPLLADMLCRLAPWPVRWLDPAPAIAQRVMALSIDRAPDGVARRQRDVAVFTRGTPAEPIQRLITAEGLVLERLD